jgi:hypothetical protein
LADYGLKASGSVRANAGNSDLLVAKTQKSSLDVLLGNDEAEIFRLGARWSAVETGRLSRESEQARCLAMGLVDDSLGEGNGRSVATYGLRIHQLGLTEGAASP